jgi:Arc/MetJ-type ribon-helix-helix transcriptional regulator
MYDDRMKGKQRLSASVDAELMQAGQEAVADGRAESMSAWVNDALRLKADHDRRMRALDEFIAAYEAEHGEITQEEIRDAGRRARAGATVVRAANLSDRPPSGRGQGAA